MNDRGQERKEALKADAESERITSRLEEIKQIDELHSAIQSFYTFIRTVDNPETLRGLGVWAKTEFWDQYCYLGEFHQMKYRLIIDDLIRFADSLIYQNSGNSALSDEVQVPPAIIWSGPLKDLAFLFEALSTAGFVTVNNLDQAIADHFSFRGSPLTADQVKTARNKNREYNYPNTTPAEEAITIARQIIEALLTNNQRKLAPLKQALKDLQAGDKEN